MPDPQDLLRLADEWFALSARADQNTGNEGEDMAAIGIRDGYSEAVQTLDVLTGGDSEYRYCTIPSDSHCPDPPAMIRRIVARLATPAPDSEKLREAVNALDWMQVYKAARKRTLNDATMSGYDGHLAREIAERLAAALGASL